MYTVIYIALLLNEIDACTLKQTWIYMRGNHQTKKIIGIREIEQIEEVVDVD